jgi:photolyase PhrII
MLAQFDLPSHLGERSRSLTSAIPNSQGEFILYWTHHAYRTDENPALDTALCIAQHLKLPLLVYAGLGGIHPFNNDRHHTFILEAAADLAGQLTQSNIRFVFNLPIVANPSSPLRALAARASTIITDDFPVAPFPRWFASLAKDFSKTPIIATDTACIVPMQLAGRAFDRAFAFRDAMHKEMRARIGTPWKAYTPQLPTPSHLELPPGLIEAPVLATFTPRIIADLVASCRIDHGVPPIRHTRGGSNAGYARWESFKTTRLRSYAGTRNNAALLSGVSRLSPYLHYGMVSPLRIAREAWMATQTPNTQAGAEKFIDELFTWREVSHNLCYYLHSKVDSLAVLPAWARATLASHAKDPREHIYSWETLARGTTHSRLWNAAQKSLLMNGELHNNIRMTWGKALPTWTSSPEDSLRLLLDLNHRYALDGNDPNSYGGLLWCMGLYDRPFTPELPVIGTTRPRSIEEHARRLDLPEYERIATRPSSALPTGRRPKVAVIGAGISGLAAARTLQDQGWDVTVFDKGRGPGGRASTRREGESLTFDHGAPYFSLTDPRFTLTVQSWVRDGVAARWNAACAVIQHHGPQPRTLTDRYVGVGGMNTLAKHLAHGLTIRTGHSLTSIANIGTSTAPNYTLTFTDTPPGGGFGALILTPPAPQSAALLTTLNDAAITPLIAACNNIIFDPCWAVMLQTDGTQTQPSVRDKGTPQPWDAAWIDPALNSPLTFISRESSKPDRPPRNSWVLHASAQWSTAHLESTKESVANSLLEAARALPGIPAEFHAPPLLLVGHRWRYSHVREHPSPPHECYFDWDGRIALAGDWCAGTSKFESAFLSGVAAAGRIMSTATEAPAENTDPSQTPPPLFAAT